MPTSLSRELDINKIDLMLDLIWENLEEFLSEEKSEAVKKKYKSFASAFRSSLVRTINMEVAREPEAPSLKQHDKGSLIPFPRGRC